MGLFGKSDNKIIKKLGKYSIHYDGKKYSIFEKRNPVLTPKGNILDTGFLELAERMLVDLDKYGYEYKSIDSILPWQFTMIDNFMPLSHEDAVKIVTDSFLATTDWTYEETIDAEWKRMFGDWSERKVAIAKWLSQCTHMQLVAICCIGNAYHSINVALTVAYLHEKYTKEYDLKMKLNRLAERISEHSPYDSKDQILSDFKTFFFYYSLNNNVKHERIEDILKVTMKLDADEESSKGEQELENENQFYTSCVKDFHETAAKAGYATKGVILIPELIPEGEKTVLAFLKDQYFVREFSDRPQTYYYVIMSLCLQAGAVYARQWHVDAHEFDYRYFVERVIECGPAEDAEEIFRKLFFWTKEDGNEFYNAILNVG